MKKAKLNLIIDALLLLGMAAIIGIGLLIKYVLVPGVVRWEIYGRNVELYFWGLGRHQWGMIHFVIGLIFIALVILHIVFHWPLIVNIYKSMISNKPARWVIVIILILLTLALMAFSYFIKPEVIDRGHGSGSHSISDQAEE